MQKKAIILFSLSLLLRLIYYGFFPERPMTLDDASSWDDTAMSLVKGNGFVYANGIPDSVRPPIYPLFLAFNYKVFGHHLLPVKLIQILLSGMTVIFLFWTCLKFMDESSAFWAGLFTACYPPLIVYSTIIGSETLYCFLLTLFLLIITETIRHFNARKILGSGLVLGLNHLCRSTLIFYPVFLIPILWVAKFSKKEILMYLGMTIISFLVVLPWTIRNYRVFDRFVLVNVSATQLFWLGTIVETNGRYMEADYEGYRQFDSIKDPKEFEKAQISAGLKNIKNNPLGFAKLTVIKFFRLWFKPIGYQIVKNKSKLLGLGLMAAHAGLIFLFIYGLFTSTGLWKILIPIYTLLIYFTIMHNLVAPMPRFRLPVSPYILLFATLGLKSIAQKMRLKT